MVATPINPSVRYSALGDLTVLFVPVIAASTLIPTRAEIDAGTDLSAELMEPPTGFRYVAGDIEMPGLQRVTGTLAGRITFEESSMMLYADRGGDDVSDVMPADTTGYILLMDTGDTPTELMDVWQVKVKTCSRQRSTDTATMWMVQFAFPSGRLPAEKVVIPAAA